jgi:glycosyltransferase involved in cell wall biosynthesis
MKQEPIFTIVTPSYNQGSFLAETIKSVIGQEGDFYIDYILIDGGSTDNSVEIIKHYDMLLQQGEWPIACRGITYRWLSERDKGQTDALMKGFRLAKGDFFAWLNSDDTYLPGALQVIADFFSNRPEIGLVYGDARYCDMAGAIIGNFRTEEYDLNKLAWFNFICQPSAFFLREAFEMAGGLDESLNYSLDYDLWVRIGKLFPCRYLPVTLSLYRLHETSKTIREDTLIKNCEEGLAVAIRHFGWAPLTRVYSLCRTQSTARLPGILAQSRSAVAVTAVICSVFSSLRLNNGLCRNDFKLLNRGNFRKLFKRRIEIMTGKTD